MLLKAKRVTGLQNEIDFMRVKIWSMGGSPQVTLSHLSAAAHAIARLATVDHRITGPEREADESKYPFNEVYEEIAAAIGIEPYASNLDKYVQRCNDEGAGEGEAR